MYASKTYYTNDPKEKLFQNYHPISKLLVSNQKPLLTTVQNIKARVNNLYKKIYRFCCVLQNIYILWNIEYFYAIVNARKAFWLTKVYS